MLKSWDNTDIFVHHPAQTCWREYWNYHAIRTWLRQQFIRQW